LQTSALPLGYAAGLVKDKGERIRDKGKAKNFILPPLSFLLSRTGAGDEGRTRDFDLGKVALYH
jgi:hypothetical protein